jgi:hypothetical protein
MIPFDNIKAVERAIHELRQHINDHPARAIVSDSTRDELAERVARLAADLTDGEYRHAYNGWKNRETWSASLWIDNDQGSYNAAREIAQAALNIDPRTEATLLPR